ncbi:MAG TPA: PEGA domain-containing protein, partial [Thermoplasmatales archaeon]|nr:PEGA domain-containing protein [Thermoplasmatales archaeon]
EEKPKLVFTLSVNKSFSTNEPIPVTTTITNKGNTTVTISEPCIYGNTLHLDITTPSGDKLSYFGPMITGWPKTITLKPGMKTSTTINIADGNWARNPDEHKKGGYLFGENPGVYTIQAFYKTRYPPAPLTENTFWQGTLKTRKHLFTISNQKDTIDFNIHVKKTYPFKQPIPVKATLTNKGNTSLKVLDFGLDHFTITDPTGKKLHYIGPIGGLRKPIILKPGETRSITLDITKLYGENIISKYEFKPGVYQIQGHYSSGPCPWPPDWNYTDIWVGNLKTPVYNFTVVDNNLNFEISLKKLFKEDEPIQIEATITNNNNHTINVSEMGLRIKSLNFNITTPDGKTLHYTGPYIRTLPKVVSISPYSSYSIKIDDLKRVFTHYNFTAGDYNIQGHYVSGHAWGPVWKGKLNSSVHKFSIITQQKTIIHGMVYEIFHTGLPKPDEPQPMGYIKPLEGVKVTAYLIPIPIKNYIIVTQLKTQSYTTYTDEKGEYKLEIKPGTYEIQVSKEGYQKEYRIVTVSPGEKKREDFQLKKITHPPTIQGIVTESKEPIPPYKPLILDKPTPIFEPKPIANATVTAYLKYMPINHHPTPQLPVFYKTHTDTKGRYQLTLGAPGVYIVEVTKKGYQKETKQLFIKIGERKRLDFQLHRIYNPSTIMVYTYICSPPTLPMPLEEVKIKALSTWSNYSYNGITDEKGLCKLQVKPGEYIIEAYKPGYIPCRKTTIVTAVWGKTTYVKIGMKPKHIEPKVIHLGESDNGKTIYVDKDSLINLTLLTNPSTGYQWNITNINHSILNLTDHFYWGFPDQPNPPEQPIIVGASVEETWLFKPITYGETSLELKYWQPWDSNSTAKTFTVNIIIGEILFKPIN